MTGEEYEKRLHDLRCVVCTKFGIEQTTPTAVHHPESVRDSDSKYTGCAICYDHHQGPNGIHGLHRRTFLMRYKLTDIDLMALTVKQFVKEFA